MILWPLSGVLPYPDMPLGGVGQTTGVQEGEETVFLQLGALSLAHTARPSSLFKQRAAAAGWELVPAAACLGSFVPMPNNHIFKLGYLTVHFIHEFQFPVVLQE